MDEKVLPVSVTVIGHNEAHNIRRLLRSVQGWTREIVLVVNDCTDGTDRIAAEEFGARVTSHSWQGHREQKNIALDQATQPWVLALDCDEEVSSGMKESILDFFRRGPPEGISGAIFNRRYWYMGRWIYHGDWYPDRALRLFRREDGRWGGAMEHDRVHLSRGQAIRLKGDLLHYSFPDLATQVGKINSFAELFKERKWAEGKRANAWEAAFRSWYRFFRGYVLKRGFLDGFPGYLIARTNGYQALIRYAKLYEAAHNRPPPPDRDSAAEPPEPNPDHENRP